MIRTFALLVCLFAPAFLFAADPPIRFSMQDMDGVVHTLEQYQGKWVIVNYWSTTCPPCLKEIPELIDFHARHKDHDAVVLGVNFEEISTPWLQEFISNIGMSYPVLRAGTSPYTPFGPVMVLPTTFLVSPDGKLVGRQVGAITAKALDAYLAEQPAVPKTP